MKKVSGESVVTAIRRRSRKKYSSEEKIRIVLDGIRGEGSISRLCRREGIPSNLYYRWSKDFLESGKKRLMGDTTREANFQEVTGLKKENDHLKQLVLEIIRIVEGSELSVRRTLMELGIHRSTFYS